VIAAEQAIGRDDYVEAERLRALIASADPQAPSLERIAASIEEGKAGLAKRAADAAAQEEALAKAAEDAKKRAAELAAQQEAAAREAAAAPRPAAPTPAPATAAAPPPVAAPTPAPVAPPPAAPPPRAASSALVAISTPQPAYPADALRKGQTGEVVLEFTVNPDGSIGAMDVVSARPRGVFERGVQSTVRRWRFQPISSPQTVRRTFTFAN
jgi:protein TonB